VNDQARRRPDDNIFIPATPWEAAVAADQAVLLDDWPTEPSNRWVLTVDQHAAYRRVAHAVLDDAPDGAPDRYAIG
jgi:hypothetical protein